MISKKRAEGYAGWGGSLTEGQGYGSARSGQGSVAGAQIVERMGGRIAKVLGNIANKSWNLENCAGDSQCFCSSPVSLIKISAPQGQWSQWFLLLALPSSFLPSSCFKIVLTEGWLQVSPLLYDDILQKKRSDKIKSLSSGLIVLLALILFLGLSLWDWVSCRVPGGSAPMF